MPQLRFQFSLRVLCLTTPLLAALVGMVVQSAHRQSRGVAWVLSQGGHVSYAYEQPLADGSYPKNARPPGPDWLRRILGIDYFSSVTGVILDRDEIDDLEPLADLSHLRSLTLMNYVSPRTDFSPLQRLKQLETLHLGYTGIGSDHLRKIREMLPDCDVSSEDQAN